MFGYFLTVLVVVIIVGTAMIALVSGDEE